VAGLRNSSREGDQHHGEHNAGEFPHDITLPSFPMNWIAWMKAIILQQSPGGIKRGREIWNAKCGMTGA
jgi:hypothetical protein